MLLNSETNAAARARDWYMEAQEVLNATPAPKDLHRCGTEIKHDAASDLRMIVQTQAELLRAQAALLTDQNRIIAQQSAGIAA